MMFHCASDTPLSIEINGRWSSTASGTRHHVGPAGPIMTPSNTATTTTATAAGYQPTRRTLRAAAPSTVSPGGREVHRQPVG